MLIFGSPHRRGMPKSGKAYRRISAMTDAQDAGHIQHSTYPPPPIMSESKFNKAVEIIGNLPSDGPIKPTSDDQLYVRHDYLI